MGKSKDHRDTRREEEGPRNFNVFLQNLAEGEAHTTLSAELFELGRKMQEEAHARGDKVKGRITINLGFVTEPNGIVSVGYDVTVKAPKPRRAVGTYWLTPGGNLSPEPVKQLKLPIQNVAGATEKPRDLTDGDEEQHAADEAF